MLKKEIIWREILHQCFSNRVLVFTQKNLAHKLRVSLSTVNNALLLPRSSGAVAVSGRNFRIADKEKFLLLWASHRQLRKDLIYQTRVPAPVMEIEGRLPPGAIFAAYTAFRRAYNEVSADYDAVYIYAPSTILPEIKRRFPPLSGEPNLFVLASDPFLPEYGAIAPPVQIFVDLWNLPHWYAKDFLRDLKIKLGL